MMKKLGLAVLFFALGSVAALAADFNGKWTADVQGRNGNHKPITFDFHVDGSTLTGKVTTHARRYGHHERQGGRRQHLL